MIETGKSRKKIERYKGREREYSMCEFRAVCLNFQREKQDRQTRKERKRQRERD